MDLREAIRIIQTASQEWADYLDDLLVEGEKEAHIEPIDNANNVINQFVRLLDG